MSVNIKQGGKVLIWDQFPSLELSSYSIWLIDLLIYYGSIFYDLINS